MKAFAHIMGDKLNRSKGPIHILIPKKGWSEADKEGMTLFDPKIDHVFVEELKKILQSNIPLEEIDVHISEPAFAQRAVEILDEMIRSK